MSERTAVIIGRGGREHALGLAVASQVDVVYFAPGNAGTDQMPNGINIETNDPVAFATEKRPSLTIIGPEKYLINGSADRLRHEGLPVMGPGIEAAQLEASKWFAYEFMYRYGIPTPKTHRLTDHGLVDRYARFFPFDTIVLKADGVADGKGVILPQSETEMRTKLYNMLSGKLFNGAGKECTLVQERLTGPEVSVFLVSDGQNYSVLPMCQDHKRLGDHDTGPNTGGMGAYSPVPEDMLTVRQHKRIEEIAAKSIDGMKADGTPYQGILYIGVMLAKEYDDDPMVIEYNVRFGDPEAQVILPVLQAADIDVYDLLLSTDGKLNPQTLAKSVLKKAVTVALATELYPDNPVIGDEIFGTEFSYPGVILHHGATSLSSTDRLLANGGRAMYVTSLGDSIDQAAQRAYAAIGPNAVRFRGMQYRTDIGWQAR